MNCKSDYCFNLVDVVTNNQRKSCCKPCADHWSKTKDSKLSNFYCYLNPKNCEVKDCDTRLPIHYGVQKYCDNHKRKNPVIYAGKKQWYEKRKYQIFCTINYCDCGNLSLNHNSKNRSCVKCVIKIINNNNYILADDIPKQFTQRINVMCKTCNRISTKTISRLIQSGKDANCIHCSRIISKEKLIDLANNKEKYTGEFYVLENNKYFKIGVTSNYKIRYKHLKGNKLQEHIRIHFSNLQLAYNFEKKILHYIKDNDLGYDVNKIRGGGHTETIDKKKLNHLTVKMLFDIANS